MILLLIAPHSARRRYLRTHSSRTVSGGGNIPSPSFILHTIQPNNIRASLIQSRTLILWGFPLTVPGVILLGYPFKDGALYNCRYIQLLGLENDRLLRTSSTGV